MKERDIIIRPLLTEKSYSEIANKKYVFVVDKKANKTEIKLAIEKLFDVKVIRAAANIPTLQTISVDTLNTYEVVKNAVVVIAKEAVEKLEEVYGE